MTASRRFERLYRIENAKYWIKLFCFLIFPAFLVITLITQNVPIDLISTKTATVTYVESTTTNAETSGGGHPISYVLVEFASEQKTKIKVLSTPAPKIGDKVLVKVYKNRFSGISYLYGGIKRNEN